MGNSKSRVYSTAPKVEKWRRVLDALGLSVKEIHKLYHTYSLIVDDSNSINIHELMVRLRLENSQFMTRVFGLLDIDKSGGIDFGEFVVLLWNYCTMKSEDIVSFGFDMYDSSGNGMLQTKDLQRMLIDIYGKHIHKHKRAVKLFDKITVSQLHCYTLESFRDFVRHHPVLLYPAFIAQQRLRSAILGKRFWQRLEKRREQNRGLVTFQHLRFLVDRCHRYTDKQSPLFVEIVDYTTNDKEGHYCDLSDAVTARTTERNALTTDDEDNSSFSIADLRDEDEKQKPCASHHLPQFIACHEKKLNKIVPV